MDRVPGTPGRQQVRPAPDGRGDEQCARGLADERTRDHRDDAHRADPGLAFALARLSHDDHSPTPFGVFRDVQRADYGSLVSAQVAEANSKKGPGDLAVLLRSAGTWQVG